MRTFGIALLTAIFGAVLAAVCGDFVTGAFRVSDFEGGRGMLIAFVLIPAGFILGGILGFIVARSVPGTGVGGFAKAQGIAWGASLAIALVVSGLLYWRAPRTPQLDGQDLGLELEVRFPEGRTLPDTSFTVLFTTRGFGDDRANAELDLGRASQSEGRVVIPGTASLNNQSSERFLVVNDTDGKHYWFDLPLRSHPSSKDLEWTAWWPAPGQSATRDVNGNGGFQVRYRVRKES